MASGNVKIPPNPKRLLSPADFPVGPLANLVTTKRNINKKKTLKSPDETKALLILERIQQVAFKYLKTQTAAIEELSNLPSMLGENSLTRFGILSFYPYSIVNGLDGDILTQEAEDEFEKLWDKVEQNTNSATDIELMLLQSDDLYLRNLLKKKEKKEKEAKGPETVATVPVPIHVLPPLRLPP